MTTMEEPPEPLPRLDVRAATPRPLVGGLLFIGAAAVLLVLALTAISPAGQIRFGSVALAAFCIGLLLLMSAAGYDGLGLATWRLGPWTLLWGAIAFGLATLSWLGPQSGPSAEIVPDSILRALWLIAAAMTMLTVGYCAGPHRSAGAGARRVSRALSGRFTDELRGPAVPWVLFAVGVVCQLGYAATSGHLGFVGDVGAAETSASGYGQFIAIAGECVPLSVAAAAIQAHRTRALWSRLTLAVLFAGAVIVGAISGGKTSFVVAIIAVMIPYSLSRRRLPAGLITAALAVFLLVVIPFNQAYRQVAGGAAGVSTSEAVATAPAVIAKVADNDLSFSALQQSADYLAVRVRSIDSPAIIMQRTPEQIPYGSPAQLLIAPFADLIPRALWAGKPVLALGYQMSQEYFELPANDYTSSAITPEGDLYRHGGWIWLIAGMLLIGCALRTLDDGIDLRRSVHGAFLMLLIFPDIVMSGTDFATLLAGIPGAVLLWLAVVALSFRRRSLAPA